MQSACTTTDMIADVKQMIVEFNQTLQGYGYNVTQLFAILVEVRERYTTVLLAQWEDRLFAVFDGDNYTPLVVRTEVLRHAPRV